MKTLTKHIVISMAMVVAASGLARAADDRRGDCSVNTLHGTYVFSATGFNIVAGVAQPKAIVEVIDLNGDGTLSVRAATVSINGTIIRSLPGGTGSYTVDADCTGTLVFNSGASFDIFVLRNGGAIQMIQTNPNTVFQGTAARSSRERDQR